MFKWRGLRVRMRQRFALFWWFLILYVPFLIFDIVMFWFVFKNNLNMTAVIIMSSIPVLGAVTVTDGYQDAGIDMILSKKVNELVYNLSNIVYFEIR